MPGSESIAITPLISHTGGLFVTAAEALGGPPPGFATQIRKSTPGLSQRYRLATANTELNLIRYTTRVANIGSFLARQS
ncbi:hypothetical protein FRC01_005307, partial [Tulasnella sp. 417]